MVKEARCLLFERMFFALHLFSLLRVVVCVSGFFCGEEIGGCIILYLFALLFAGIYAIEQSLEIGVIFAYKIIILLIVILQFLSLDYFLANETP